MITWLIFACADFEGRREIGLLIAVVAAEFLSKDKAFFYIVHCFAILVCSFEK